MKKKRKSVQRKVSLSIYEKLAKKAQEYLQTTGFFTTGNPSTIMKL